MASGRARGWGGEGWFNGDRVSVSRDEKSSGREGGDDCQQVTEPTLENGEVAGVCGLDSSNNVSQGNVGRTVVLKVCFLGQQQQHLGTH